VAAKFPKRSRKREAEMRWLAENRDFLWGNYAGKWIAVQNEGLVGAGDTAEEATKQALASGYDDPLVTGVRKKEYQGVVLIRSL